MGRGEVEAEGGREAGVEVVAWVGDRVVEEARGGGEVTLEVGTEEEPGAGAGVNLGVEVA